MSIQSKFLCVKCERRVQHYEKERTLITLRGCSFQLLPKRQAMLDVFWVLGHLSRVLRSGLRLMPLNLRSSGAACMEEGKFAVVRQWVGGGPGAWQEGD